uniref:mitogen-activated protein kinase kinase n=1 Tax=Steinernema glaseri TaxID=37863 RepID=A0A1I7YER2_9BILA
MPLQVKVAGGRHDGRLVEVDDVTLMFFDTFMASVSGGAECAFSHFEYEDDEGDRIAVRNDDDLQVMISQAPEIGDVISIWLKSPSNWTGNVHLLMDELNSITPEDLQHLAVLSQGQSLDVRNDRVIAVKCVSIDGSVETQKSIVAEIGILKQCCGSPFIVDFYGAAVIDSELCICLELMDGRSAETYGKLPTGVLFPVCVSVLCGLEFLWTNHVMHRDVKPSNFLLNSKGQVKLSDFGVSKQLDRSVAQSYVGTNAYMAPERIFGGEYRICSDVWSYGLSVAEMAIGRFPLAKAEGQSVDSVIQSILLGHYEETLKAIHLELKEHSDEFMHFVFSCLKKEISERATAEQLVTSAFVQKNLPIDTAAVASFVISRNSC